MNPVRLPNNIRSHLAYYALFQSETSNKDAQHEHFSFPARSDRYLGLILSKINRYSLVILFLFFLKSYLPIVLYSKMDGCVDPTTSCYSGSLRIIVRLSGDPVI
jgi:hypothetical protein